MYIKTKECFPLILSYVWTGFHKNSYLGSYAYMLQNLKVYYHSVKPLETQKLDKEDNCTAMSVYTVIQASTLHWMQLTAVQPVLTRYEPTGFLFHTFYLHRNLSCVLECQFQVPHSSSCNMGQMVCNAVARFTDFKIPQCLCAV